MVKEGHKDVHDDTRSWQPKNAKDRCKWGQSVIPCTLMFLCCFYHKWVVHYKFIEHDTIVNHLWYLDILKSLRESVLRKRPELWPDKWIFYHDNAPAQTFFFQSILEMKLSHLVHTMLGWMGFSVHCCHLFSCWHMESGWLNLNSEKLKLSLAVTLCPLCNG